MDPQLKTWIKDRLQKRAAGDAAFRQALLDDLRTAIEGEIGEGLPPEYDVQVLEEESTAFYLVLTPPPPGRDSVVTLRELTRDNVHALCKLEVTEAQKGFVAPNAISIAESHFSPAAWTRAIYADDTPVGFVMLIDDPEEPRYYLWRYMIAGKYQGMGFGKQALQAVIEYVRSRPDAREMTLSYVPGDGSPHDFYVRLGFMDTGKHHGGEFEMRLAL